MKRKIYFIAVVILTSNFIFSQSARYPNAQAGFDGIFVLLSDQLNPASFRIERSEAKKLNWIEVGNTQITNTGDLFVYNFQVYSNRFRDLLQPRNEDLETVWSIIQRTKNIDSLFLYGNSPVLRLALGISFFDSAAEKNKSYRYRITQTDSVTGRENSHTTNDVSYPGKVNFEKPLLKQVRSNNDKIFLQWRILPNERLSSFLVFRQSNAKGEFEKINVSKGFSSTKDSILLTVQDQNVDQNNFYKYFVIPTDIFGNRGEAADEVFCGVYDFASISLPMDIKVESLDSLTALKLSWQIPAEQPAVNMQIFRSEYFDSSFTLLAEIPYNSTEYIDYAVEPMQKYFYYLQLVGPMRELSPSTAKVFGFCQSSEEPIPPTNLKAEPLSNGVRLTWHNSEDFIEGFWVYRTDGISDSLRLISSLIKEEKPFTTFYDTTNLSGKLTYQYAVRSASVSHVLSTFSDTLAVRPAIKTMPPLPLELIAEIDESKAIIKWKNMTEIDSTVWGYFIYRRISDSNSEFTPLTDSVLFFYQNSFEDGTIKPGNTYEYMVKTIDMFGGISDPAITSLIFDHEKPIAPEGLSAVIIKNTTELTWNESLQSNIKEYKVYRQLRNTLPELISTTKKGKDTKVIDKSTVKGELYFYFVTAVSTTDLESDPSQIISVRP